MDVITNMIVVIVLHMDMYVIHYQITYFKYFNFTECQLHFVNFFFKRWSSEMEYQ